MDIIEVNKTLFNSLSLVNNYSSKVMSQNKNANWLEIIAMFEEYADKLNQYENIPEPVEWTALTANEFVTSIQTTIGLSLIHI